MEYNVNKFKELVLKENTRHNLISRRSIKSELDKHIEDCLKLLEFVSITEEDVIDIGSGAGFPGLVLALFKPEAKFTLVEADLKKSLFLKIVKETMKLENVDVIRKRVEEIGQDEEYRDRFDICTSRAVASMKVVLEYGLSLIKVGGKLMLWKGRNYHKEISDAKKALQILGGSVENVYLYNLMDERDRAIVVVRKEKSTPVMYPRRVGIPVKRPL